MPPNTPVIELQTRPYRARTLHLDSTGAESTDDPEWDIEAMVQITDMDDENINTDIEIEVMHLQKILKHAPTLETWGAKYNIEQRPDGFWWKDDMLVIVENDDLRRGVTATGWKQLKTQRCIAKSLRRLRMSLE